MKLDRHVEGVKGGIPSLKKVAQWCFEFVVQLLQTVREKYRCIKRWALVIWLEDPSAIDTQKDCILVGTRRFVALVLVLVHRFTVL